MNWNGLVADVTFPNGCRAVVLKGEELLQRYKLPQQYKLITVEMNGTCKKHDEADRHCTEKALAELEALPYPADHLEGDQLTLHGAKFKWYTPSGYTIDAHRDDLNDGIERWCLRLRMTVTNELLQGPLHCDRKGAIDHILRYYAKPQAPLVLPLNSVKWEGRTHTFHFPNGYSAVVTKSSVAYTIHAYNDDHVLFHEIHDEEIANYAIVSVMMEDRCDDLDLRFMRDEEEALTKTINKKQRLLAEIKENIKKHLKKRNKSCG